MSEDVHVLYVVVAPTRAVTPDSQDLIVRSLYLTLMASAAHQDQDLMARAVHQA